MQLISRVNKSGMIAARQHIVSPVMQALLIVAAIAFIGMGIDGYIEDGDVGQLVIILLAACIIVGEYIGVPYIVAIIRLESMELFYDTKVLNFYVAFGSESMYITSFNGESIGEIEYDEITKYVESKDSAIVIAGFHVFIFDKEQAEKVGLRQHLAEHDVKTGTRKG